MYVKQEKKQVVHPLRTIIYSPTNKHKNQHQLNETKHLRLMKKNLQKRHFPKKKKKITHRSTNIYVLFHERKMFSHTTLVKIPIQASMEFPPFPKEKQNRSSRKRRKKKSHEKISHARAH